MQPPASSLSFSVSWLMPSFSQSATLGWDVCCFWPRVDGDMMVSMFIKQISWMYGTKTRRRCWKIMLLLSYINILWRFWRFLSSRMSMSHGVTKMSRRLLVCCFAADNIYQTRHGYSAERVGSLYLWYQSYKNWALQIFIRHEPDYKNPQGASVNLERLL